MSDFSIEPTEFEAVEVSALGGGLSEETMLELEWMAVARSRATGRPVVVTTGSGADRMSVHDVHFVEGETRHDDRYVLETVGSPILDHLSSGLGGV
jgi:hypothetical protein